MPQVPEQLELLNQRLPPATYKQGRGVLDHLLGRAQPGASEGHAPQLESAMAEAKAATGKPAASGSAVPIDLAVLAGPVAGAPGPEGANASPAAAPAAHQSNSAQAAPWTPSPAGAASPRAMAARTPPSPLHDARRRSSLQPLFASTPFVAALGAAFSDAADPPPEQPVFISRPGLEPVKLHPK